MKKFNIALDGPSGAGKSSVADRLAERFGMKHMDTGAMYRAVAYALNKDQIPAKEDDMLKEALARLDVSFRDDRIYVQNEDVTSLIRQPEVSLLASRYSALPSVRTKLVALQQQTASQKGYILDGRDICDVVLPDAEVKIYLDASSQARALRRYLQDKEKGKDVQLEQVQKEIEKRDEQDRTRAVSPLRISPDAVVVDSSDMNLEQTLQAMEDIVWKCLQKGQL